MDETEYYIFRFETQQSYRLGYFAGVRRKTETNGDQASSAHSYFAREQIESISSLGSLMQKAGSFVRWAKPFFLAGGFSAYRIEKKKNIMYNELDKFGFYWMQ